MSTFNWANIYTELCEKANQISSIQWKDLWHNQVGFLVEEHPFPTPALFFNFRISDIEENSNKSQQIKVQVDMYYFYESFLDTYQGSFNQEDALAYLNTLTEIHKVFHGSSGETYSSMERRGFAPVDTGSAGNLYVQNFVCEVTDDSASPVVIGVSPRGVETTPIIITGN
ncbi:hypothetical protein EZY14_009250 [Kordia sp. TARA_039_SRF]|nr:hypothetical protein EZY14_009250 [Kordia sp. TARA_039_SRF]